MSWGSFCRAGPSPSGTGGSCRPSGSQKRLFHLAAGRLPAPLRHRRAAQKRGGAGAGERLLAQELKIKSEEAAVAEQNRIYNQLTVEVGPQLAPAAAAADEAGKRPDRAALFRQICLIGAYVKRRCSLRLIEQSDGTVSGEDLALSFRELTGRLAEMGVEAQLSWSARPCPPPPLRWCVWTF
jgi:hypothetical protein